MGRGCDRTIDLEQLCQGLVTPVMASRAITAASVPKVIPFPANPVAMNCRSATVPIIGRKSAVSTTCPDQRSVTRVWCESRQPRFHLGVAARGSST